jgi:Protein of unknown function (DUF3047)
VRGAAIGLIAALVGMPASGAGRVVVGDFSAGDLTGWEPEVFHGKTAYDLVRLNGQTVLRAQSDKSASGLVRRVRIDLVRTPVLHWRWRVENVLRGVDERTKAGDDYPARVYVIFSGGLFFWNTRAINYVWSNNQPAGTVWPNAFTAGAQMVAVESGTERVGRWVEERRNVREDFARYFGNEADTVDAVALMTDTDNSGQSAVSYYGNMYFAAE